MRDVFCIFYCELVFFTEMGGFAALIMYDLAVYRFYRWVIIDMSEVLNLLSVNSCYLPKGEALQPSSCMI